MVKQLNDTPMGLEIQKAGCLGGVSLTEMAKQMVPISVLLTVCPCVCSERVCLNMDMQLYTLLCIILHVSVMISKSAIVQPVVWAQILVNFTWPGKS